MSVSQTPFWKRRRYFRSYSTRRAFVLTSVVRRLLAIIAMLLMTAGVWVAPERTACAADGPVLLKCPVWSGFAAS